MIDSRPRTRLLLARTTLTALIALLVLPATGAGAATAGDELAIATEALGRCSDPGVSRSPEEIRAAADEAEAAFAALLPTAPLAAQLGLARTLMECRIETAPMMEKVALMQRIEGHLEAALGVDPTSADAHFLYAVLLYHVPPFLERGEDAIRHLDRLLELTAEAPADAPAEAYLYLGDLHLRHERRPAAEEAWRRGLAAHPGSKALAKRLAGAAPDDPPSQPPAPSPAVTRPSSFSASGGDLAALVEQAVEPGVPGIAVAVACGERLLLLAGFGLADVENRVAMDADSVVRIGSVGKQLTAVTTLRLAEKGIVPLERPVASWLPPPLTRAVAGITVHHLLTHTAGLPRDVVASSDWLTDSLAAPRVGLPGERYAYSNLGYALLGRILETATGEPLGGLLARLAIAPAGLVATAPCDEREIVPRRARGYAWRGDRLVNADPVGDSPALLAAGGLCSTARDLLLWQRALHGGRLLSAASYRTLTTPPSVADPAGTTYAAGLRVASSGGRRVIRHSGGTSGFLSELAHDPEADLSLVVVTNGDAADPRRLAAALAGHVLEAPGSSC